MTLPRIAIIMSTTRAGRFGERPAHWVLGFAKARQDMQCELIDLRDYPLPFFDEPATNLWVPTRNPIGQRWQQTIAGFDGYLFVTAEYNRGVPAVLKNALDYAYPEWNRKPAAYLGYGSVGGARSVEQLRLICVELQMAPLRSGVHIQGADFIATWKEGKPVEDLEHLEPNVKTMLDELVWWSVALKRARDEERERAAASSRQAAVA